MAGIIKSKNIFNIKEGGVELLFVCIELPEIKELGNGELFNKYYRHIGLYAGDWAREFAKEKIQKEYDDLDVYHRKFKFRRYEYYVFAKVAKLDEKRICIKCIFRLMRSKKIIMEKEKDDIWSSEHFLMMRYRIKAKNTANTIMRKKHDESK